MHARVMTWTSHGVQQVGELPGVLPRPMPALWYVEPIEKLDEAAFGRLVALVRSEHIPGLSLRNQMVARWLGQLTALPELGALVLDGTDIDGATLGAMQLDLTRLYLAHTAVDDAAVAAVVERYPALEVIDLEDTAVGDAGARAIARLGALHAVNLAATQITDDGGAALGALGRLEIADLGSTRIGARTVAALRRLPLHELFLDRTRVRGEIQALAPLAPGLTRFDISGTPHHPTDQELGWLRAAPNLIEVGVSGAKLHDPLALALVKLPTLRELRMADTLITATTIHAIAGRTELEEVDLAGTPVDDASAALLFGAPRMRILRLDDTPITDAALTTTPGPQLVELYVSRTAVGDQGMAMLDRVPRLAALGLGHTSIGEATLERIGRLGELHTLVLSRVRVPPAALAKLAGLHALERLYLDLSHADDTTLAALEQTRETLRVLHLAGSDVSEGGLPALRTFTELDELTIGDTRMHAGIAELSAWPRLRTLSLVGLDLTDKAVPSLAARPSLVVLDLSATEVRDPSPLTALPHLRTLGVAQARLSAAGVAAVKRLAARGVEIVR
jgi:Leucine-rich repeat (LRR) protein